MQPSAAQSLMSAPTPSSCWWRMWRDGVVQPVLEDSEQTRLGAGFYETQPVATRRQSRKPRRPWRRSRRKARELQAVSTRVIATSAARDAVNPADLTSAIERASGLKVEIISGEQEADLGFPRRDHRSGTGPPAVAAAGCGRRQHGIHSRPGRASTFLQKFPPGHGAVAGEIAARRSAHRSNNWPRAGNG